jgi:hypothetical protein
MKATATQEGTMSKKATPRMIEAAARVIAHRMDFNENKWPEYADWAASVLDAGLNAEQGANRRREAKRDRDEKEGRKRIVWTDPVTKRTRLFATPIPERIASSLDKARDYIARSYAGRADQAEAVESVRVEDLK